jgi:hypothetical protein
MNNKRKMKKKKKEKRDCMEKIGFCQAKLGMTVDNIGRSSSFHFSLTTHVREVTSNFTDFFP